ncbi:hypothetical protein V2J09_006306 [Rumex salicifolius]
MAASANPSGNNQDNSSLNGTAASSGAVNGNSENSGLKHVPAPGISTDWTLEEITTLEEGLSKYSTLSPVLRYAKIAQTLPKKTVRDVALRCRYTNKKEISKRRKDEPSRKSKDKKEKVIDSSSKPSHLLSRPGNHPYSGPPVSTDDDGISYKDIGGPTGEMLEQNAHAFQKISANFSSYLFQENINLFSQARENIAKILNRNHEANATSSCEVKRRAGQLHSPKHKPHATVLIILKLKRVKLEEMNACPVQTLIETNLVLGVDGGL